MLAFPIIVITTTTLLVTPLAHSQIMAGDPSQINTSSINNNNNNSNNNIDCPQLQLDAIHERELCFNNAAEHMYISFITPDAGHVGETDFDPDAAKMALKAAKKAFKKDNKKCSKILQKDLKKLRKEKCPHISPNNIVDTFHACAMDGDSFSLCVDEIQSILIPEVPTGRVPTGGCCPLATKPGYGNNQPCSNGKEPKCCPGGSYWGCGMDEIGDGYYDCPLALEPIFMGNAELGTVCDNTLCDRSVKITCVNGREVFPDENCQLNC